MCLQEHLHFVTEICQDEVFILDHEGPVVSQGASTGMPDLVVEPSAGYVSRHTAHTGDTHTVVLTKTWTNTHKHVFYL